MRKENKGNKNPGSRANENHLRKLRKKSQEIKTHQEIKTRGISIIHSSHPPPLLVVGEIRVATVVEKSFFLRVQDV